MTTAAGERSAHRLLKCAKRSLPEKALVMIIDHIDKLELSDEQVEQHYNELRALDRLWVGLSNLDYNVRKMEAEAGERLGIKTKVVHSFGNNPRLEGIPQDLVACAFDWYSITACNYVKLTGWLLNAGDTRKANEYLQNVIPEVYVWRNKVGAHFALTDPRPDDTPADLAKSVMFPISFDDDAFYAGSLVLTIASEGQERPKPEGIPNWRWRLFMMSGRERSSSRKDMRWSLTHTHRQLSSRYRPNQ